MNKRCVIISGGSIDDAFALEQMQMIQPEFVIGVDSGLKFLYRNQIMPTHIVGDFDSVDPAVITFYKNETQVPIREFNPVKDASDTEIALKLAIELGAEQIWILGGTGTRLDHVMANMQMLKFALDAGVKAYILDKHNRISLVERGVILKKEDAYGAYFSIFPLGGSISGFNIEGAKYPLSNHILQPYDSLCVSNQFLDECVKITFPEGVIILMETRD